MLYNIHRLECVDNMHPLDYHDMSDGASLRMGVLQTYVEPERVRRTLSNILELFEECGYVVYYRTNATLERTGRATVGGRRLRDAG